MNSIIGEHISDWFDSYDLFSGTGKDKIHNSIKQRFPSASNKEIKEAEDYLDSFYEYCLKYADILAVKYKSPYLPKGKEAQKEISDYVSVCQKKYPEFNAEIIVGIFSTACWLANR